MTARVLLAAVAATASLVAACGAEDPKPASSSNRQGQMRKAMLDLARCMREHGVDMPDPKFEGGRVMLQGGGPDTDPATMRAAEKACARYRDSVKPPELSESEKQEFKQAALANARCMREHGI